MSKSPNHWNVRAFEGNGDSEGSRAGVGMGLFLLAGVGGRGISVCGTKARQAQGALRQEEELLQQARSCVRVLGVKVAHK